MAEALPKPFCEMEKPVTLGSKECGNALLK
jgi:hypothetical protein